MNKKHKSLEWQIVFLLILLTVCFTIPALAKGDDEEKFKLAETYEKSGDLKNASRLYVDLLSSSPYNDKYFEGVVRTYKAQSLYGELLPIVKDNLELRKTSYVFSVYGELLWKLGKTQEANKAWDDAMELNTGNERGYTDVANSQIACHQYEKAIKTLNRSREELKIQTLFADELSQLYTMTGNFRLAMTEVLNVFEQTRNINFVQGKISAFLNNKEAAGYINSMLKDKMNSTGLLEYKRLYAWFLRGTGNQQGAFEIYKDIDNSLNSRGYEVLTFANSSQKDGKYDIALKAYEFIIGKGKSSPYITNALYGFARTLEYRTQSEGKINSADAEDIIVKYKNIIKEFPQTPIAEDCRLRIATLQNDILNDLKAASATLTELIDVSRNKPITAQACNLLGDIFLKSDNLEGASSNYQNVIQKFKYIAPEEYNISRYKLAEIEYFKGNIDSSESRFGELSLLSGSDIANDALEKVVMIEGNKSLSKALQSYARAELLEKQQKLTEAIAQFTATWDIAEGTDLAERSLIRVSKIYFGMAKYDSVRVTLDSLLSKYPKTIYADIADLTIANSWLAQKNRETALRCYTEFLNKYPRSIFLDEVREKIRQLRKENM